MNTFISDKMQRVMRRAMTDAQRVVVLTGAGVSAESGLPTFRDAQTGWWARFKPEDLASPEAFQANPGLVWSWYEYRRLAALDASPNAAHKALAAMQYTLTDDGKHPERFTLITQNVDGLHQRAGSQDVIELHGSLHRPRCSGPCGRACPTITPVWEGEVPICVRCSSPLRPDVVWFGESLDDSILTRAVQATVDADLFLSVGTSGTVEPAASFIEVAAQRGASVVRIGPDVKPSDGVVYSGIHGRAGEVLPALLRCLQPDAMITA